MSINQKSGRQTFRRRFVSGSLFVSPCPPECNFQSETKIEPDLRLEFFGEIGRNFLLTTMFFYKKYSSTPTMCEKFSRAFEPIRIPSLVVCCYSQSRFDEAAKFFSSENKNLFKNQSCLDGYNLRSGPILTASILTFFLTWSLFFLPFPSEFYLERVTIIEPDVG